LISSTEEFTIFSETTVFVHLVVANFGVDNPLSEIEFFTNAAKRHV
jgi:hypothetical protein